MTLATSQVKPSVRSHLAAMDGRKVKRTVSGILTVEDLPEMRKNILKIVIDQGFTKNDITETENHFEFSFSNQLIFKPKFKPMEIGTLVVRSKDLIFHAEDGTQRNCEKKGFSYAADQIKIEKLISPTKGGLLTYELL